MPPPWALVAVLTLALSLSHVPVTPAPAPQPHSGIHPAADEQHREAARHPACAVADVEEAAVRVDVGGLSPPAARSLLRHAGDSVCRAETDWQPDKSDGSLSGQHAPPRCFVTEALEERLDALLAQAGVDAMGNLEAGGTGDGDSDSRVEVLVTLYHHEDLPFEVDEQQHSMVVVPTDAADCSHLAGDLALDEEELERAQVAKEFGLFPGRSLQGRVREVCQTRGIGEEDCGAMVNGACEVVVHLWRHHRRTCRAAGPVLAEARWSLEVQPNLDRFESVEVFRDCSQYATDSERRECMEAQEAEYRRLARLAGDLWPLADSTAKAWQDAANRAVAVALNDRSVALSNSEALAMLKEAAALIAADGVPAPGSKDIWSIILANMAFRLANKMDTEQARALLSKVILNKPSTMLGASSRIGLASCLPWIIPSINAARQNADRVILEAQAAASFCREFDVDLPWQQLLQTSTINLLSFVGTNTLEHRRQFMEGVGACTTTWNRTMLSSEQPRSSPSSATKVGFVSTDFYSMTMSRLLGGVMLRLASRDDVHVTAITPKQENEFDLVSTDLLRGVDDALYLQDGESIHDLAQKLTDLRLDVLVYTDISWCRETLLLAGLRIAPVQALVFNNGQTSALRTIDYYISTALEQPRPWGLVSIDDQAHHILNLLGEDDGSTVQARLLGEAPPAVAAGYYSERLYLFPADVSLTYFPDPNGDFVAKHFHGHHFTGNLSHSLDRSAFGVPSGATVYGCTQSLFKFHPSYDKLLGRILLGDDNGILLLAEAVWTALVPKLLTRLVTSWAELGLHVDAKSGVDMDRPGKLRFVVVPGLTHDEYLALMKEIDVMLDPYPFGGGLSSYEAFAAGPTPVVTLPAHHRSGRLTYSMLTRMGCMGSVATDEHEYIQIANLLGKDSVARQRAKQCLSDNLHRLQEDERTLSAWRRFLAFARQRKTP